MFRIARTIKYVPLFLLPCFFAFPSLAKAVHLNVADAVEMSLARSPVVAMSQKKLEAAEARELKSVASFLPRLDFQESYLRTDQPVASFGSLLNQGRFTQQDFALDRLNHPDSLDNFETKFVVHQPLFMGGKLHNHYTMARNEKRASQDDVEGARADAAFRTIGSYWGLSLAGEHEKVARMAVETAEESLRQIELLHKEGTVVRSDLLSARVRLADFQNGLVKAKGRARVAEKALALLIGDSPDGHWDVAALVPPASEEIPDLTPDRLLATAKGHRPDYASLKARCDSAQAAVRAAWGELFPNLGLEASYEWNSPRFAEGQEGSYILGMGLQWNLFKGFEDRAGLKEARSNEEMIRYQLRALEDQMVLEIEEAAVAVATGRESLQVTEQTVGQAEENLRIVRQRYKEGLTTVVELEQAELAVSRSRLEWLGAIFELRIALARLKLVTGDLIVSSSK